MREQSHRVIAAFQKFLTTTLEVQLERYQHTSPESVALALFHDVAATVPAYKTFLREHSINPASV